MFIGHGFPWQSGRFAQIARATISRGVNFDSVLSSPVALVVCEDNISLSHMASVAATLNVLKGCKVSRWHSVRTVLELHWLLAPVAKTALLVEKALSPSILSCSSRRHSVPILTLEG